ncbi:MAG: hypothetical protein ACXWLB_00765 [Reyranella sp.]
MGVIDGGTIGQIVGAQIGGMSIELEQMPCTALLTHWQTHSAKASDANCALEKAAYIAASNATRATRLAFDLIRKPPSL